MTTHHFVKARCLPWQHCDKCGLIALKNPVTRKAMSKDCRGEREGVWDVKWWNPEKKQWERFVDI